MAKKKRLKTILVQDLKQGDEIHEVTNRSLKKKEVITFDHVDGMYSYNTLPDGEVVHLGRFVPLVKVDDHYELIKENNKNE